MKKLSNKKKYHILDWSIGCTCYLVLALSLGPYLTLIVLNHDSFIIKFSDSCFQKSSLDNFTSNLENTFDVLRTVKNNNDTGAYIINRRNYEVAYIKNSTDGITSISNSNNGNSGNSSNVVKKLKTITLSEVLIKEQLQVVMESNITDWFLFNHTIPLFSLMDYIGLVTLKIACNHSFDISLVNYKDIRILANCLSQHIATFEKEEEISILRSSLSSTRTIRTHNQNNTVKTVSTDTSSNPDFDDYNNTDIGANSINDTDSNSNNSDNTIHHSNYQNFSLFFKNIILSKYEKSDNTSSLDSSSDQFYSELSQSFFQNQFALFYFTTDSQAQLQQHIQKIEKMIEIENLDDFNMKGKKAIYTQFSLMGKSLLQSLPLPQAE
eukprot:Awhi_evm1s14470